MDRGYPAARQPVGSLQTAFPGLSGRRLFSPGEPSCRPERRGPTAAWTAQQIVEAFPNQDPPRYLLRDRDGIYGHASRKRVAGLGVKEALTLQRGTSQVRAHRSWIDRAGWITA